MDSELKTPYKISLDFYIRKIITVNAKQLDSDSRVINITCTENGKKFFVDSSTTSAFVRYKKSDGHSVLNQVDILSDGTVNLELSQQMLAVEGRQLVDIMLINKSEIKVFIENLSLADDGEGNVTIVDYETEIKTNDMNIEEIMKAISENGIKVLSTMSFYINTEGITIDSLKIESSYEYNALIEGLGKMVAVEQRLVHVEENAENAIQECNTATESANTATSNANTATTNANNATTQAKEATNNADKATQEAQIATEACQEIIEKVASIEDFSKIDEILNYKVEITQAEYEALSDVDKNNGKIYFITDVYSGGTATEVFYNNTKTGFKSANIQDVIDELNEKVEIVDKEKVDKSNVVNNLTTTEEGFILDARQGSILKNEINNSKFQYAELKITSSPIDVERGKIPFTETGSIFYGNCFSFDDGCFVIGDNVNVVRVTASIYGNYSDSVFLYVTVNESEIFRHYVKVNQGEYNGGCFSSIIQVTRGDKISIHTSKQLSLGVAGLESCFTIEKLD